jgi:AraC-like DNA-binding protein
MTERPTLPTAEPAAIDPIDDMLGMARVSSSLYVRVRATVPWGIEFASKEQARLVVITQGACVLASDVVAEPLQLAAGDAFIVQAGVTFTLQDKLGREITDCDRVFAAAAGHTAEYGGPGALTEIVSGRFSFDVSAAAPLLALLPQLLYIRLDDKHSQQLRATLQLMALETSEDGLGSSQIVSRLADVLFVQALRAWCATEGESVGWLAALQDPHLSKALRAMHADLARDWTVDALASEAGFSRSAFAASFKAVARDTPLGYLTFWRMFRAKQLLRDGRLSLIEIAERVGYDTDTALSRAFKRTQGVAPGEWRRREHARHQQADDPERAVTPAREAPVGPPGRSVHDHLVARACVAQ